MGDQIKIRAQIQGEITSAHPDAASDGNRPAQGMTRGQTPAGSIHPELHGEPERQAHHRWSVEYLDLEESAIQLQGAWRQGRRQTGRDWADNTGDKRQDEITIA